MLEGNNDCGSSELKWNKLIYNWNAFYEKILTAGGKSGAGMQLT